MPECVITVLVIEVQPQLEEATVLDILIKVSIEILLEVIILLDLEEIPEVIHQGLLIHEPVLAAEVELWEVLDEAVEWDLPVVEAVEEEAEAVEAKNH